MDREILIRDGEAVLCAKGYGQARQDFEIWKSKVLEEAKNALLTREDMEQLLVKFHFVENEYSESDSRRELEAAVQRVVEWLRFPNHQFSPEYSETEALKIIRDILNHFHLFMKALFQDTAHGRAVVTTDQWTSIEVGNEYDVQRMIYAVLLPLFPELRMEVHGDNGYSGTRSDLYLGTYDLIIEIKCSRERMTEKQLTEELGSDGFHYQSKNLFIFVYDKVGLIKNAAAYKNAFYREPDTDRKRVRMFVTQPIYL